MIQVFKINDLIKYFIRILIPIFVLLIVLQVVSNPKLAKDISSNIEEKAMINVISDTITPLEILENTNEEKENKDKDFLFLSELAVMKSIEEKEDGKEEQSIENVEVKENNENEVVEKAKDGVSVEVVPNNVNPRVTNEFNGVKINNTSSHELTEEILNPDITINNKKVIIYHTHTCESYTSSEKYYYEPTGNYRTTDLNFSVARVGDELDKQLSSYGISVVHDKTYHDHPAYNGSYSRSLITAQNALANNPDAEIMIDLHRDAIGDETYAPKVKIGDEYASQLMFVMGGLNENWVQNLKFAVKVMLKANELYPGLFKPIILRDSEYNQHLAKGGCIIEVGSTGNTLDESINSMKYLAKILSEI